ncbi:hypothetical protein P7C73_g865, partial [Tremellales sp. Uapishka_1]
MPFQPVFIGNKDLPSIFLDLCLTVFMTMELRGARSGFPGSNRVLDKLQTVFLRNGFLVLSLQMSQLILFIVYGSAWDDFASIWIGKIYIITVISILTGPRSASNRHRRQEEEQGRELSVKIEAGHKRLLTERDASMISPPPQNPRAAPGLWSLTDALASYGEGEKEERDEEEGEKNEA